MIDGRRIDLSHLEPFGVTYENKRLGRVLTVDVRFSNHCFTVAFQPDSHPDAHVVMDHTRRRAFDPERYRLSRRLPDMVRSLGPASVWLMPSDRNFAFAAMLDDGSGRGYPMFFHLRRARDVTPRDLAMVVESAYPVAELRRVLAGAMKISFPILCAKIFRNERVGSQTRR